MAVLIGRITKTGQAAAGLRVAGYEEVQIGDDEGNKPCRLSNPIITLVGEDVTDPNGEFRITYTPTEDPDACAFRAAVRVRVFDGAAIVWRSLDRPVAPSVRFDHDIQPAPPPPDPGASARVAGVLTRCGRPAAGFRIVATEVVRIGEPYQGHPCVLGSPVATNLGSTIVAADGSFEVRYTPVGRPEDACSFEDNVRVEAFDGSLSVWRSPARPFKPTLRFDHELYPGCTSGSTLIRVVDEAGRRVAGAEVFVRGVLRGRTDNVGQLFVPGITTGSQLAARLRLVENPTDRGWHNFGSDRNWNYHVYITSVQLSHDSNGDSPTFQLPAVTDPTAVQDLVIQRRNVLFGFNILVSVEWDATTADLAYYRDRFLETSELIFNGTDGQFLIERLEVRDSRSRWDEADYRIYADWDQPSNADLGALDGDSGRVRLNPYDAFYPGTIYHEFGHYAFSLKDEYKAADCWPDGQPVYCTIASVTPGTPFSEGGGKDSCVMRGARFDDRKKVCSSHAANPHVNCTAQGSQDCWSTILERFAGLPAWRLLTPVSRGAIVDRLPDSLLPLGTSTLPPVDVTGSYIPVVGWKPVSDFGGSERPGERPGLIVRTLLNGAPANNVLVELREAGGRTVRQGRTQAKNLPSSSTGEGEILVRGAHVGDKIRALVNIGTTFFMGEATVPAGTDPLVVEVRRQGLVAAVNSTPAGVDQLSIVVSQPAAAESPRISIVNDGESGPFRLSTTFDETRAVHAGVMTPAPNALDSELVVTAFDESGRPTVVKNRIASTRLFADEARTIRSAGGELELMLPEGAIELPAQVLVEEAQDVPTPDLGGHDTLLVPPHRVMSSHGDSLRKEAMLHLNGVSAGPSRETPGASRPLVELLHYDAAEGKWQTLNARRHAEPITASARIKELGVFALVLRR